MPVKSFVTFAPELVDVCINNQIHLLARRQ